MSVEKAAADPLVLGANPSEETPSDTSSVQIDPIYRDGVRAAVGLLAYANHGRGAAPLPAAGSWTIFPPHERSTSTV